MSKVIVPIQYKDHAWHGGHNMIINRAKVFGDVTVHVLPPLVDVQRYLELGTKLPDNHSLDKMEKEARNRKVNIESMELDKISNEEREKIYKAACSLVAPSTKNLPDSIAKQCISTVGYHLHPKSTKNTKDYNINTVIVKGPDPAAYTMANLLPVLTYDMKYEVVPNVIVDPVYKIKAQDSLNYLAPFQKEEVSRLVYVVNAIGKDLKIGSNYELIEDVGKLYKGRSWKLAEATVMEGGIVPGRLEYYQFRFRDQAPRGTWVLIEEIRLYA